MSAAELRNNPIAVPRLGPFKINHEDWQMLVRHAKAFAQNPVFPMFAPETVFVIVSEKGNPRILLLPVTSKTDMQLPDYVRMLSKDILAFGYVRGESESDGFSSEFKNESRNTKDSVEPTDADAKLSVEIDRILGKPVCYIIMNRKFDYDIYKTPIDSLYGILQPMQEESFQNEEEAHYPFECQSCDAKFRSISEARSHVESNSGHKIFRMER